MAYDGFFLTYKNDRETNERYDRICEKYPNFRMVKINLEDWTDPKIVQAVKACGKSASTKHFWVIDPDCKVDDALTLITEPQNGTKTLRMFGMQMKEMYFVQL